MQFGVGLAAAILLDATLVRAVLLLATMKPLGDRNWYLPRWLEWLPRLEPEEPSKAPEAKPAGSVGVVVTRIPAAATRGRDPPRPVTGRRPR
jgi:hypothetical protein